MTKPAIGFVGLGAMGFGMATHLVQQGYEVHGFDVFPASVNKFSSAGNGAVGAGSLRESADGKMFYVCMVASAAQVQSVLFGEGGIVDALPQNATLLLCSTVPATYAGTVASELQTRNRPDIQLIDAPVSGGAKRAAEGSLSIMAGGSESALSSGQFLLDEMAASNKLYLVPGGIGAGSNMKMVHQVLAGIHILGASEVMGFASRLGLDAKIAGEGIMGGETWTWMHENRLPRMVEEDWNPGASALTIILKDVGIITSSARQVHFPTPLSSTAEQIYLTALSQGYGGKDDSAMIRQYYPDPISQIPQNNLSADEKTAALKLVQELMLGINICAAAEAVAFARYLNVDLGQFYKLVSDAAGASKVFMSEGLDMIQGKIGAGSRTVDQVVELMEDVIQKGRDLNCPLHLGNSALNLLLLAKRGGHGGEGRTSVIKVYG